MAFKIAGPKLPPAIAIPPKPEAPAAPPPLPAPAGDDTPSEGSEALIDPQTARYFGPESRCEGCIHFDGKGACEVVSGPIDPQGICMLYLADSQEPAPEPTDQPMPPEVPKE